jgi:hypothetical protein
VVPPPLVPVPDSETVRASEPAVMVHVALSALVVLGLKTTEAVHVPDAGRAEPQVVNCTEKSPAFAPVIEPALKLAGFGVVFETVMVCAVLVDPSLTLPKERLVGDAVTLPVVVFPPVPDRETESVVEPAVSVQVAFSAPLMVGLKVIVALQPEDAARLVPQDVLEMEKSLALVPLMAPVPSVTEAEVPLKMEID